LERWPDPVALRYARPHGRKTLRDPGDRGRAEAFGCRTAPGLEYLSGELKQRYKNADQVAARALKDGYWVETIMPTKKLPLGSKGHIVEVRREHVCVHFPELGHFTVSAKMLRKIDEPPGGCSKPEPGA
jgi:hypothetical protein